MTAYNPRDTNAVYESLCDLADQRTAPTPISDAEYYPAVAELMCWKTEFELAERIAYAHPLNPEGAYERLMARHMPVEQECTAYKVAFDKMMSVIEYAEVS